MHYTLYLDSLFFLNFCINYLLLSVTCLFLKRTATRFRKIAGAVTGSAICCILFVLQCSMNFDAVSMKLQMLLGNILSAVIMLCLVLGIGSASFLMEALASFYGCAFLIGGALLGIGQILPVIHSMEHMPGILVMAALLAEYIGILYQRHLCKSENLLYQIVLDTGNDRIELTAFANTGNSLREPISGKPVCIVKNAVFEEIVRGLPLEKTKLIPYHSIGKEHGLLYGIIIPKLSICYQNTAYEYEEAVIAGCPEELMRDKSISMILHPKLLENWGKKHDF
ncbi:MAG: sigma-E processing peptidase SpoIIGA [Lachnospiraceae bacterium]|nr:sigma-E processing peptidase SpoIIGA [Lachnospiraceae bacterium]